jgi:hypothetical protein
MIVGVTEGYKKTLEINGTGYRVTAKGKDLEFALGFSHPVNVAPPAGKGCELLAVAQLVEGAVDLLVDAHRDQARALGRGVFGREGRIRGVGREHAVHLADHGPEAVQPREEGVRCARHLRARRQRREHGRHALARANRPRTSREHREHEQHDEQQRSPLHRTAFQSSTVSA